MRHAAVLLLAALPALCGVTADDPAKQCVPAHRKGFSGDLPVGKLIHRVEPVYPDIVEKFDVRGVVYLRAVIAKDGSVQSLQMARPSHFLLIGPVIEAVRQWKYEPTLLNCLPVEVETSITVVYRAER